MTVKFSSTDGRNLDWFPLSKSPVSWVPCWVLVQETCLSDAISACFHYHCI